MGRVVVAAVVVRTAYTRRHNYKVTSAPPSRLSLNKQSSVIDGIRQAQCLAVAVPAASCSRSGAGSRETPVTKTGTGPRDDALCPRRPNADGGETCQEKP